MTLELLAIRWLRLEKRCEITLMERSPRYWACGQPDAIGVTKARYMYEIEVKRTLSDFRHDFTKRHRQPAFRDSYLAKHPKYFWYLMPNELALKAAPDIPEWAGLLAPRHKYDILDVLKPAPVNQASKRLTVKECCSLVHMMANQILSLATAVRTPEYLDHACDFMAEFKPDSGYCNFQI